MLYNKDRNKKCKKIFVIYEVQEVKGDIYIMAKAETDNAAVEARRAYKREWARRNPDKVKAAQQRYWEKKAAQMQAQEQQGAQA